MTQISAENPYPYRRVSVLDTEMAYLETGQGEPIVFLHGNPTSSYLWRNIIPHVEGLGRCLAPDLVGMGQSDRNPAGSYRFVDHYRYLEAWFEAVGATENVILVIHDWGSALGFDWAYRHPGNVKGIAYMEAILFEYEWSDWPDEARKIFQGFRSPTGDTLILEKNYFVELVLPGSVMRGMTDTEMDVYRRPFFSPGEDRRPTLSWPRQIPIEGEPNDVVEIVKTYGKWLATSNIPKLFVNADPGSILTGRARDFCRTWPHQEEVTVKGLHFLQEDSPDEIGQAVAAFIKKIS